MTNPIDLFPARIPIGQFVGANRQTVKVGITPEFYRALQDVLRRVGGPSSEVPDLDQIFLEATSAPAASADDMAAAAQEFGAVVAQQAGQNANTDAGAGDLLDAPVLIPQFSFAGQEGPVIQPQPQQPNADVMMQPAQAGSPLPFLPLTVTASPMTILADRRCAVHVAGAVDALTYSRTGVDLSATGAAIIEMNLGDTLTVEYTSAPTLTLIPR